MDYCECGAGDSYWINRLRACIADLTRCIDQEKRKMMAEMSFAGSAPEGDANGLASYVAQLLAEPKALIPAVVILDTKSTKIDHATGSRTPTIRIRRIEVVLPEDRKAVARILARALERRTGKAVLPLELEDQIEEAFGLVDREHPESDDDSA